MKKKLCRITALLLAAVLSLGGCGQPGAGKKRTDSTQQTEETKNKKEDQSKSDKKGPEIDGLTYESTMDLTYATEFDVYDYKDGYKLLDVHEDRQYLVVPEGKEDKHVIEGRVDLNNLYGFIGNTLTDAGIRSRFEFGIKENGKFILTSKNFLSHVSDDVTLSRKIFPGESSSAILYLKFPDASSDTAGSVWMVLPGVLITIAIVFCAVFCLIVIVRQKKLSVIKNDFINKMTHEFKTPIATISLASQMLKDGAVTNTPETIDRVATIIRDESKRLTFQVERVLQTALFTETRMKLKLKNININQLIEDLLPKFSLRVEDKGGKFSAYLEADQDEVLADEVHVTNVISNLVDNAIKYCTKVPEISVYTRNKGQEIIISVIDNGIGIAAKEQKLIFERFYRVSTGNLHDVKGFGLGLSYVKTIVEAHGGRIEVESAEGKGSRFDIILPLTSKKQKVKRTLFF